MAAGKVLTDGGIVTSDEAFIIVVKVTPGTNGTVVLRVKSPPSGTVLTFE
jgi:hypothetical protein